MANERDRWNDQAVDGLAERVSDAEDQIEALRQLPERMAELAATVHSAGQLLESIPRDLRDLRKHVDARFDTVDEAHERARPKSEGARDLLKLMFMYVIAPVLVASVIAYLTVKSGASK